MFIGQGAGEAEERTTRPFQGPAGKLLRSKIKPHLESKNLNIILDNTIRARPLDEKGKNRAPTENELQFCLDHVWERINEFKPEIIVPLGASATGSMIPKLKKIPIGKVRGISYSHCGFTFFPTYHPAAILHAGEEELKTKLEKTMCNDINTAVTAISNNLNLT